MVTNVIHYIRINSFSATPRFRHYGDRASSVSTTRFAVCISYSWLRHDNKKV